MKCLVVSAHPLKESLCRHLTQQTISKLQEQGHDIELEDLYSNAFQPELTVKERGSYYLDSFTPEGTTEEINRLIEAEALILLFPTWWFSFPAILKGWFDRIWGPGIAYDHADDLGAIKPRLLNLKRVMVITTLGSPWWVDRLIMRKPVKRVIKTALLGTCTKRCQLEFFSLYNSEKLSEEQVLKFSTKINKALSRW